MNHMPWDDGTITDAFCGLVTVKTTKTQCGVRVSIARANHKLPTTCEECLSEMRRREKGHKAIELFMRVLESDGLDAANALFAERA